MKVIYNQELSYKELCKMMGDRERKGGSSREVQMKRWLKDYEIIRVGRGKFVVTKELAQEEKESQLYSRKRYDLQLKEFARKRHIKIITPIDGKLHSTDEVQYECEFHPGIVQESKAVDLLKTVGCPLCSYPMSRFEVMLYLGIKDSKHRSKIEDVEYDIVLPEQKIAIEVDGILYHSGEDEPEKEAKKYEVAERNGYRLIKIYEQSVAESKGIYRNGDKIYMPPYSSANRRNKEKIVSLIREIVPFNYSESLWEEAADYMRKWKHNIHKIDLAANHSICQYSPEGDLIAEYKNFDEIKNAVAKGEAFGFKWEVF